jgi:site-specific recombinase XerD
MNKRISLSNFNRHIESFCEFRLFMNHQPSSVAAARKDLRACIRFQEEKNYRGLDGARIIQYIQWLSRDCKNSPGTINRKISSLKTYIKHLRLHEVPGAADIPVEYLQRARDAYKGPIYTLKLNEALKILQAFDGSSVLGVRDKTLFTLVYGSGLRIGEAVAIKLEDINFKQQTLLIHGKGKRERVIPLLAHQVDMLQDWMKLRRHLKNAEGSASLFLSKKGNQLSVRRAEETFKEAIETLGALSIDKVTPHTLRHAFASHAVEGKCDLVVLKAILGHAYLKTTEWYVHPSIATQRKAMDDHLANEALKEYQCHAVERVCIHRRKRLLA